MFIATLFVLTCQDFRGADQEACRKAVEAGAIQSGFYQAAIQIQDYTTESAEKLVISVVGQETLAYPAMAVKMYADRAISYNFRPKHVLGLDRVETRVDFNGTGSENLKWSF